MRCEDVNSLTVSFIEIRRGKCEAVRGSSREIPELGRRVEQKQVLSLGPPLALRPPQRCALRELAEMHGKGPRMTTRIDRDGALVTTLRRGDPTAAEDPVSAYGDRAYRLATRITCDPQDAEEAVQDASCSRYGRSIRFAESPRSARGSIGSWRTRPISVTGDVVAASPISHWTSYFS